MKTFRYILTRSWILLLILVGAILYITFALMGAIDREDFVFVIGDGQDVIACLAATPQTTNKQLVPPDVLAGSDQVNALEFSFIIQWNPEKKDKIVNNIDGLITVSVGDIYFVNANDEPIENNNLSLQEIFIVNFPNGNDMVIQMNTSVEIIVVITLRNDLTDDQIDCICGQRVGISFDFDIQHLEK